MLCVSVAPFSHTILLEDLQLHINSKPFLASCIILYNLHTYTGLPLLYLFLSLLHLLLNSLPLLLYLSNLLSPSSSLLIILPSSSPCLLPLHPLPFLYSLSHYHLPVPRGLDVTLCACVFVITRTDYRFLSASMLRARSLRVPLFHR